MARVRMKGGIGLEERDSEQLASLHFYGRRRQHWGVRIVGSR
jgi:hypothetical protein